jgi:hypothetical protein
MKNIFVTVATFKYSSEAHIYRGKLESEGIKVYMADALTIDVDPLLSNAIGGVKLKVAENQKEKALNILDTISKYSLDDDGKRIVCPSCNNDKVNYFSTVKEAKSFFWFLIGFFFSSLPFYIKYKYHCQNCKTEFDI